MHTPRASRCVLSAELLRESQRAEPKHVKGCSCNAIAIAGNIEHYSLSHRQLRCRKHARWYSRREPEQLKHALHGRFGRCMSARSRFPERGASSFTTLAPQLEQYAKFTSCDFLLEPHPQRLERRVRLRRSQSFFLAMNDPIREPGNERGNQIILIAKMIQQERFRNTRGRRDGLKRERARPSMHCTSQSAFENAFPCRSRTCDGSTRSNHGQSGPRSELPNLVLRAPSEITATSRDRDAISSRGNGYRKAVGCKRLPKRVLRLGFTMHQKHTL